MSSGSSDSVQLDDETLAMLLSEVSAMISSQRPLSAGLAELDGISLGKLGRAANSVRSELSSGRSAAEAIASMSGRYQAPVKVALEVMARTRSTEPIYETVRMIRESSEQRRQLRIASINPLLNTLISAAILFFVMPWLLISIAKSERIRNALSAPVLDISEKFSKDFFLAASATVIVVGVLAALLYWGFSRVSGEGVQTRDYGIFCRWLAMQVRSASSSGGVGAAVSNSGETAKVAGVDLATAIEASAEVVGHDFALDWHGVVERIRSGVISGEALAMPTSAPSDVQQCVVDLAASDRTGDEVGSDLESLGRLYHEASIRKRLWWTNAFPRLISWVLMISMMVILLRTMLMPMLDVIEGVFR